MTSDALESSAYEYTAIRSQRINVLALLTDAYGGHGGIAQYNRDFLQALSTIRTIGQIDAAVRIAPDGSQPAPSRVVQHRPVKSRIRFSLSSAALTITRQPSIIFNGHLYHSPLASGLAWLSGAKLVSQLHGTEVWGDVTRPHLEALERSALVLCVSRDTEARILSVCPSLKGRTFVLPNTVNSRFSTGDRAAARRKFGLGPEKIILTVARLDGRGGYKGHDRIIRLLPGLLQEHGGALRYLIAGEGEDRSRLEAIAGDLGVSEQTRFLGHVPADDLPDLYRAADVFAMPSTGEGFGIVYLEAMACGTPAIGLNVGGVWDAFDRGRIEGCVAPGAFGDTLAKFLRREPPDPEALSQRVIGQFGPRAFSTRLGLALEDHGILHG